MESALRGEWQLDAACLGVPLNVFFPVGEDTGAPLALRDEARAKAICFSCPVIDACREWAIESGQEFGIFGGMTPNERRMELAARVR